MHFHRGRLFDHVHLHVNDLKASKQFYTAILAVLGIPLGDEREDAFWADELYVSEGPHVTQKMHLAFQANDRETVQRFHAVALANGGTNNGEPGERDYHPGYYAAYALDPDGNNIEAVYHGPAERSAPSVIITAGKLPSPPPTAETT